MSIGESLIYSFTDISTERENLKKSRQEVCKSCPLYQKLESRIRCNSNLLLNTTTGQVLLNTPQNKANYSSFVEGCGCTIDNLGNQQYGEKPTVIGNNNTCPANRWNTVESNYLTFKESHEINQEELSNLGITKYAFRHNLKLIFKEDPNQSELE